MYKEEYKDHLAYPSEYTEVLYHRDLGEMSNHAVNTGMTLLDYFAAKAMESLGNEINAPNDQHEETYDRVVRSSYMLAAKMMEERKKYLEPTNTK